ncbi:DUF2630 family protein [Solwaraspora sp. WMMD406]|uniref:DUF2630 family protein n=1 Tax=Solwaraspora sp. WMMD406 TaxID=3016095 RepID=UPI002417F1CE|nr:DUF2630 family protein [Solwaraspora sp. WMMD406]MDG4765562.1 DUF2630 family protein [Solwaraspora sp. WMMD406]
MDDRTVLARIHELVDEEHELRTRFTAGELSADQKHDRLRAVEEALDQCWDLLRRRRAARQAGTDPDYVAPRPTGEVESYLQ